MSNHDLNEEYQAVIDRDNWQDEANGLEVKDGSKNIGELIRQHFSLKKTGGNSND